jgi:hypothetical protein
MSNPKPDMLVDIYDDDGKLEHHAVSLLEAMGGDPGSFAQARSDIENVGEHCGGGGAAPFYRVVPTGAIQMTAMTFEAFQATRRQCDDLGAALHDATWVGEPPAHGNLYLNDALYIEQVAAHWPAEARAQGKWHLIIGRDEWVSDDLESLECRLFEFADSEGLL